MHQAVVLCQQDIALLLLSFPEHTFADCCAALAATTTLSLMTAASHPLFWTSSMQACCKSSFPLFIHHVLREAKNAVNGHLRNSTSRDAILFMRNSLMMNPRMFCCHRTSSDGTRLAWKESHCYRKPCSCFSLLQVPCVPWARRSHNRNHTLAQQPIEMEAHEARSERNNYQRPFEKQAKYC